MKVYNQNEKGKVIRERYAQSEEGKIAHRKAFKKYARTEKGKAARKRYAQSEKGKVNQKRFYVHHPNQIKAKKAVYYSIKIGRLPRPDTLFCHYCNHPAEHYHHWQGYEPEHWLDVVPACVECHKKEHRKVA